MKPKQRHFQSRLCVLFFACLAAPTIAIADSTLAVHAVHDAKSIHKKGEIDSGIQLTVWVYLRNVGREVVKVPTANYGNLISYEKERSSIVFVLALRENPLGIAVIPSESELRIVTLQPGETALIEEEVNFQSTDMIFDHLTVEVRVAPTLAERFDLWRGSLPTDSRKTSQEVNPTRGEPHKPTKAR